jgi:cell wall-associated NlpC family hydrolase
VLRLRAQEKGIAPPDYEAGVGEGADRGSLRSEDEMDTAINGESDHQRSPWRIDSAEGKMTTRAEMVGRARAEIGTPWVHQAYLLGVGVDCIGLIGALGLNFGIDGSDRWRDTPEWHNYSRPPNPKLLLRGCAEFLDRIEVEDARPADILLMEFDGEPMHVAMISALEPMYVVHALSRLGRVAEHRLDDSWRAKITHAYRFRGIV